MESLLIVDFGSQYTKLIAKAVRELGVYAEIVSSEITAEEIQRRAPKGLILSGGPASVYTPGAPQLDKKIYKLKIPILGICYGMQLLAHTLGGEVALAERREYGHAVIEVDDPSSPIWAGLPRSFPVWMSHSDQVVGLPPGFRVLAHSDNSPVAAMADDSRIFGLQFHPEVAHTPLGKEIIRNFLYRVCGCKGEWTPANFIAQAIEEIRAQVGKGRVLCALSGGVDSAVTAALVHRAVGDQLTCVFVNNGLLRREEPERVIQTFQRHLGISLVYVEASDLFLERLRGVIDPEEKRRIIGETFIHVFEGESRRLGDFQFIAQGTTYPDVIESAGGVGPSAKIKTHHNVGGLPKNIAFRLVEPLRYLFKDEVRRVGLELGLPEELVYRHPFPGPGLAVRIVGEVTREKLEILRACDWIVMDEIKKAGLYRQLWQSFAVLTDTKSVGVMGDCRTYGYVVAVRAVTAQDAMTADWARLPYDVLATISSRIVNEVPGVNRVVYDITSKPPGTIEWE